jgi:hypothetical protein
MPFNVELQKQNNDVIIKLQIAKNTITFYFNGSDEHSRKTALNNCLHLESHFIKTIPGFNPNWVRGSDALHVKKNHTNAYEIKYIHFHTEFNTEITPLILSTYLRAFYQQQKEHKTHQYNFFVDGDEVAEIIAKYRCYYNSYKNSSIEDLYEEETKLSKEEEYEMTVLLNHNHHVPLQHPQVLFASLFQISPQNNAITIDPAQLNDLDDSPNINSFYM